jgi:hypothetical protein
MEERGGGGGQIKTGVKPNKFVTKTGVESRMVGSTLDYFFSLQHGQESADRLDSCGFGGGGYRRFGGVIFASSGFL